MTQKAPIRVVNGDPGVVAGGFYTQYTHAPIVASRAPQDKENTARGVQNGAEYIRIADSPARTGPGFKPIVTEVKE